MGAKAMNYFSNTFSRIFQAFPLTFFMESRIPHPEHPQLWTLNYEFTNNFSNNNINTRVMSQEHELLK